MTQVSICKRAAQRRIDLYCDGCSYTDSGYGGGSTGETSLLSGTCDGFNLGWSDEMSLPSYCESAGEGGDEFF